MQAGNNRTFYTPTVLLATAAVCLTLIAYVDAKTAANSPQQQNKLLSEVDNADDLEGSVDGNYDKRMERYSFGLGRRAYTYNNHGNGMKRLPVYNFGLGKRARPYSFGLGKRSEYDDDQYIDIGLNGNIYDAAYLDEKRNRPYSFRLDKRSAFEQPPSHVDRYNFGLGRR